MSEQCALPIICGLKFHPLHHEGRSVQNAYEKLMIFAQNRTNLDCVVAISVFCHYSFVFGKLIKD